jgi:hypothetical protein
MDGGGVNLDEQPHQYIASIEPTGCRESRSSPARYHLQDHKHNGWIQWQHLGGLTGRFSKCLQRTQLFDPATSMVFMIR